MPCWQPSRLRCFRTCCCSLTCCCKGALEHFGQTKCGYERSCSIRDLMVVVVAAVCSPRVICTQRKKGSGLACTCTICACWSCTWPTPGIDCTGGAIWFAYLADACVVILSCYHCMQLAYRYHSSCVVLGCWLVPACCCRVLAPACCVVCCFSTC